VEAVRLDGGVVVSRAMEDGCQARSSWGVDGDRDRAEGVGDVARQRREYSHSLNEKRALRILRNIVTCGLRLFEIIQLLLQIGNGIQ
jgi:hypothetical protein